MLLRVSGRGKSFKAYAIQREEPLGSPRTANRILIRRSRNQTGKSVNTRDFPFSGEDAAVVSSLRFVAQTFSQLQDDRHAADYNLTKDLELEEALKQVKSAEDIFNTWQSIRGMQIAQAYLVSQLVKRI
jgi:hypothetical protein